MASKDNDASPANQQDPIITGFNELVHSVELADLRLIDTKASFLPPNDGDISDDLSLDIESPQFTASYEEASAALHCGVRFNVEIGCGADSERTKIVAIFAEYHLVYELPAETRVSNESAQLFASRNAIFNAWPYFRELVHSMSGRMNLPPAVIPLMRLPVAGPRQREQSNARKGA